MEDTLSPSIDTRSLTAPYGLRLWHNDYKSMFCALVTVKVIFYN